MRQSIGRFIVGLILITGVGAGTGLGAALLAPGVAGADGPFTVNDVGDAGLAVGGSTVCESTNTVLVASVETNTCTLRAAIEAANNSHVPTVITLPNPEDATLVPGPDYLVDNDSTALGQLDIDDLSSGAGQLVTIDGAGQSVVTIEGTASSHQTRILKVEPDASASITGVTIKDGDSSNSGEVGGGILNCSNLTLTNSTVTDNSTNEGPGGGIYAETLATTNLDGDTVSHNAGEDGGGIYADGGTMTLDDTEVNTNNADDTGQGGGIFIDGQGGTATSFTMEDGSTVADNNSVGDGGGIEIGGTGNTSTVVDIDGSTVLDNGASDGSGGGIAQDADSTLTVTDTTIDANGADESGGGVFLQGDSNSVDSFSNDTIGDAFTDDSNDAQDGGGVYIEGADPTFTDVNIDDNNATGSGGGVYISGGSNTFTGGSISNNDLTGNQGFGGGLYIGFGTNTFSGESIDSNQAENGGTGGGSFVSGGTNTFTNTTVDSNQAIWTVQDGGGEGGGFYFDSGTNTFTGGSIDSNSAYDGGGAFLNDGTETFTQTDISSNTASESGAGLYIYVVNISLPTTITSSTISQNTVSPILEATAPNTVGSPFAGDGGGILAESCEGQDNQINLTNDTIAGNTASVFGGGYYSTDCLVLGPNQPAPKQAATPHVAAEPVTNFVFDTINANTSDGGGGGNINTTDDSTLNAAQTIIAGGVSAGSPTTNCSFTDGGTLNSLGYNLIDDTTCGTAGTGDILNQAAHLGALGNNGGPTNTELPASNSPAIGGVPAGVCSGTGVTTDQRGNARGTGANGSCTIGSVEVALAAPPAVNLNGYRLVANEGGIFDFGLNFHGSLANNHLNAPIVGIANSPGYDGYLMAGGDGGVFALGGANFYGSLGGQAIPSPISAIAAPPSENGYWLAAQNGKIYNFGAAPALPALSLPSGAHIVGMASTQDGGGAWLTDQLGDVYAEGDALYEGGLGGVHINKPIVGIAAAASGQGYVLAASDGGAFNYGTQGFYGSVPGSLAPGQSLVAPIVGIAVTHSGKGYWFVGADGGVFNYGDAPFLGSIYTAIGNHPLNGPVVGIQHLGELPSA